MKRLLLLAVLACLVAGQRSQPLAGQGANQAEVELQAAIKAEVFDGNLKTAIERYQRIITTYATDRPVVAQALVRMGQCYERLGDQQAGEARKAYERVVREFADQADVAAQARVKLAALRQPPSPTGRPEMIVRRVWEGQGVDLTGAPSRDGAYLTFDEWPSEDLAIHDFATGKDRPLTKHRGTSEFVYFSVPSPDGKHVAYGWHNSEDVADLRIVGIDGSEPRILYGNPKVAWPHVTDWSSDGRYILAVLSPKGQDQIALIAVSDGSVRVLRSLASGSVDRPRLSPDGRYVAYDSPAGSSASDHDIFLLAVDSGREIALVRHSADDRALDWTPDGKAILFSSDRAGTRGAWLLRVADGTPQGTPELVKPGLPPGFRPMGFTRQGSYYYGVDTPSADVYVAEMDFATGRVTAPPVVATQRFAGSNIQPDWSSDGRRLLFLSRTGNIDGWGVRALCVRSSDTGEVRELVPKLTRINWVRWFPDGRSLLAGGNPQDGYGLYRIDAQTGEYTRLTDMSLGWRLVPSRDGKAIYCTRYTTATGTSIMEFTLESGQERELCRIAPSQLRSGLSLSPDGQQLAFVVVEGESQKALKLLRVRDGVMRELLRGAMPFPASVAWTPDGQSLLFMRETGAGDSKTQLWLTPVQGGEPRKLDLAVQGMRDMCVHPDGRHIAFAGAVSRNEVWVMENFLPSMR
jgi:Tol biopolymer transport system component